MSPPPNFSKNSRKWVNPDLKGSTKIVKNQATKLQISNKPQKKPTSSSSTLRKTFKPDNRVYCRYFNATGICRNHKFCKFEHDFSRVKICSKVNCLLVLSTQKSYFLVSKRRRMRTYELQTSSHGRSSHHGALRSLHQKQLQKREELSVPARQSRRECASLHQLPARILPKRTRMQVAT